MSRIFILRAFIADRDYEEPWLAHAESASFQRLGILFAAIDMYFALTFSQLLRPVCVRPYHALALGKTHLRI